MHCRLLWHPCSWSLPLDARSTLSPSYHSQDCLPPDIAQQHLEKKSLWLKTADMHMSQSTCMVLNGESDTVQFSSVAQSCPALCIRWPKYWSFSFSISPSNEYSGLISFRMDWLDLLAVQRTLKSLLQHHSSKASILWCSTFFIV